MPMIDLTVPKGALTPEHTDRLIRELSRIIIEWEGAEELPMYPYATRMYVHEVEGVAVASQLHDPEKRPYYRVIVSVPEGTLSQGRKTGVIKDMTAAILHAEGEELDPRHLERVWVIINDVPTGHWGSGGQPRGVRELIDLFGLDPQSDRYKELMAEEPLRVGRS
ncbi:MAG: tautomerase family protein [Solirubrobacterales bacterium]